MKPLLFQDLGTFLFGVRLVWIVSGISIFLVILVLCTSSFHKPPRYHWLFGYLGFVISVSYIYAFANEVSNLEKFQFNNNCINLGHRFIASSGTAIWFK